MRPLTLLLTLCFSSLFIHAQEADTTFNLLSLADPQVELKTYNQGVENLESEKYTEAVQLFNQVLKVNPENENALFNSALAQYLNGNYSEANILIGQLMEIGLKADYSFLKGLTYVKLKEWGNAENELSRCLGIDANYYTAYYLRAQVRKEAGDQKGAVRDLLDYTQFDTTNAEVWHELAWLYYDSGQYELALDPALNSIQIDAGNPDYTYLHSLILIENGKRDEAIRELLILSNRHSDFYPAFNEASMLLAAKGEMKKAEAMLAEIVDKTNQDTYKSNYGFLLYRLERYTEAIQYFDQAIQINPDKAAYYFNRGACKEMIRDHDGACSDWRTALQLGMQEAQAILEKQCK